LTRLEGCPCAKTSKSKPKYRAENGNCTKYHAPDGLPFQCVGAWARDKHDYVRRYLRATRAARAQYVPPNGHGGAAFVDLFAGPGYACGQGNVMEGSPLIALAQDDTPFTTLILCEIDGDNLAALTKRTAAAGPRVHIVAGNCNQHIDEVMKLIPPYGLNLALVDPFAPQGLVWKTLEILGTARRMDFIINFPTGPIKRNFPKPPFHATIDRAIGTCEWRSEVHSPEDAPRLIEYLKRSLATIGYTGEGVRSIPIKNSREGVLYHLVFATKHPLGNKIWDGIARTSPGGARELPWGDGKADS
jgi:three-Cys-motif partner protein